MEVTIIRTDGNQQTFSNVKKFGLEFKRKSPSNPTIVDIGVHIGQYSYWDIWKFYIEEEVST